MDNKVINNLPLNIIYYGPPGTGKTWRVQRLFDDIEFSKNSTIVNEYYNNENVINKLPDLKIREAIVAAIYDLGNPDSGISVKNIMSNRFVLAVYSNRNAKKIYQSLQASLQLHSIPESETVGKNIRRSAPYIFNKVKEEGATKAGWRLVGNWREECADIVAYVDKIKNELPTQGTQEIHLPVKNDEDELHVPKRAQFVTFHQSYGYEEFVEGIRPVLDTGNGGNVRYEIRDGIFKKMCKNAQNDPMNPYAIIIDEINRGNISKIFGELITLIEDDKREGCENSLSVTLPYSGEEFSVPSNLHIIGTMNTADRSIAVLDIALRRRFDFQACYPDTTSNPDSPLAGLMVSKNDCMIDVRRLLEIINLRIEALYDREHTIGHGYFTPLRNITDQNEQFFALSKIMQQKIIPLLEEYFFDDFEKIRLVLADNQKSKKEYQFIKKIRNNTFERLFGITDILDGQDLLPRYEKNQDAFSYPEAFQEIYLQERSIDQDIEQASNQ